MSGGANCHKKARSAAAAKNQSLIFYWFTRLTPSRRGCYVSSRTREGFARCLGFTLNILSNEEQSRIFFDYKNIGKIYGKVLNSEEVEIRIQNSLDD